jgi:hypothetical protein
MSSVNYSLNHKGVRLISSNEAWLLLEIMARVFRLQN